MNKMTIIYKNDDNIKFFGKLFIKNNKGNCFLLINNQINELCLEYNFNKKERNIKVILFEENDIKTMSDMFSCCESLLSLPDKSKWNTNNATNMSGMFSYCKSLSSLPDISKWNINNVVDMNSLFFYCKSLSSLPDISKWNIILYYNKNLEYIIFFIESSFNIFFIGIDFINVVNTSLENIN